MQSFVCRVHVDASATFLENECYNKYGKTGKSFYYSQVASSVRWLSTASSCDLTDRLGAITSPTPTSQPENVSSETDDPATTSPIADQRHIGNTLEDFPTIGSHTPTFDSPMESASTSTKLPPIPSFSEFINSRKVKDNQSRSSQRQSNDRVEKNPEKRMKLQ